MVRGTDQKKEPTLEKLGQNTNTLALRGKSNLTFFIGGADLSENKASFITGKELLPNFSMVGVLCCYSIK